MSKKNKKAKREYKQKYKKKYKQKYKKKYEEKRLQTGEQDEKSKGSRRMPGGKPNILILWGDDIGITNLSCYSDGLMGYRTPNIDRIADEGIRFTDYYGEQSCTAGRAAFITGQNPYRTGLTKVGLHHHRNPVRHRQCEAGRRSTRTLRTNGDVDTRR